MRTLSQNEDFGKDEDWLGEEVGKLCQKKIRINPFAQI